MIQANQGPWKYIILWLRYYYAIHFLKSGINFAVFGVYQISVRRALLARTCMRCIRLGSIHW